MSNDNRFGVLDGWRGVSILVVLSCHLLPLGPKILQINLAAGLFGMSIFFTLSGFLVTHFLLFRDSLVDFLIRRLFRILPLAWLYIFIALLLHPVSRDAWMAHLFFYANYPPKPLVLNITEHFWSLCVEVHFYLGVAFLVAMFKKRGLLLLPIIAVGITLLRIFYGMEYSVITHFRVDEILTGATLALIYEGKIGAKSKFLQSIFKTNFYFALVLLFISCSPFGGFMNYLRPYLAALLVGITLYYPDTKASQKLKNNFLFYIATISYALYVVHPLLASTWLGSGDLYVKYMKRPLLFASIFLLAHISTYYYEHKMIGIGRRLSKKIQSQISHIKS